MTLPVHPPLWRDLLTQQDPNFLGRALGDGFGTVDRQGRYLHWDDHRHRSPRDGYTHEQEWLITKLLRVGSSRQLPLVSTSGQNATFVVTDQISSMLMDVDRRCGGNIGAPTPLTGENRDRVLVNSLHDESITSSQLEGANTTRKAAKQMLRESRAPTTHSERMIVNSFLALEHIRIPPVSPLTIDEVLEIHGIISRGTLDDPEDEARLQRPGDERVAVYWQTNGIDTRIHQPPPAEQLPERLQRLCDFANDRSNRHGFLHPVLRALVVHFWIGYDHPFVDGNGRLARTLFYRSMLGSGYWLAEFLSVSSILRKRPAKYVRSYLLCETDDLDLTYFLVDQLTVIVRALDALDSYLARKRSEIETVSMLLRGRSDLNHRQLAFLGHALRHPGWEYTIKSHQSSHRVVYESARQDLLVLEQLGLLERFKSGREYVFRSPLDLDQRLKAVTKRTDRP